MRGIGNSNLIEKIDYDAYYQVSEGIPRHARVRSGYPEDQEEE